MNARPARRPGRYLRPLRRAADCLGALIVAAVVMMLSTGGAGAVPALGPVLSPGTGVWRLSPDAGTAGSATIMLPALDKPGTVAFETGGGTHITAGTDQDLFRMIGFVDARYRLTQMDLERRQALGELSAVLGKSTLKSDTFELDLGLNRAAQRDWEHMAATDPARVTLTSYAQGVNAAMKQLETGHQLPTLFKLLGYTPKPWTPVDSLAIQRLMTQTLSFSDAAVTWSYAAKAIPHNVFDAWFPAVSANPQVPYDQGPYQNAPLAPLPVRADPARSGQGPQAAGAALPPNKTDLPPNKTDPNGHASATALGPLEERLGALPVNALNHFGNSNAWVISGEHTQSGEPILAGDPHLQLTLPSPWYQMEGSSPGYHFTGVVLPGIPAPLMGKTGGFAWAVTNSQHPVTLFYLDKTDPAKPGQYFWRGGWHRMGTLKYQIRVKGRGTVEHTVRFTAQGPVLSLQGVTASVWWAGTLPSTNLDSALRILRAQSFAQFRDSLRGWATPSLNFLYAGKNGDIGAVTPGVAPQVPGHEIALPLPGDGSADVAGTIPFDALPTVHDPASGYIISANNREVTGAYPYEYSTSYNFADPGYRAQEIADHLAQPGKQTFAQTAALQTDVQDSLAQDLNPYLLKALAGQPLTGQEQKVAQLMRGWNGSIDINSPQAFFFQKLNVRLSYVTFDPWWKSYNIPKDPLGQVAMEPFSGTFPTQIMYGTVLSWIQHDPGNPFFSLPDGTKRNATTVLRLAFRETVQYMTKKYGPDISKWRYGAHFDRVFPSLLSVKAFDAGPYPAAGDPRTVSSGVPVTSVQEATGGNALVNSSYTTNAAALNRLTTGASWRFIIDWGTGQVGAVLPGGDSENPISPWYRNGIPIWLKGGLLPVREGATADRAAAIRWRFTS
ncbi:MAG: penicillin acylase family protein [Micromonosporaceae bacterium]